MATQIISKRCSTCKQTKSLNEFARKRTTKDGYQYECKICQYQYQKQYLKTKTGRKSKRKSARKYYHGKLGQSTRNTWQQSKTGKDSHKQNNHKHRTRFPECIKARNAVAYAVKTGRLPHPDSLQCHYGDHPAQQYHHHKGYAPEYWLDVVPVCVPCHFTAPCIGISSAIISSAS